MPLLPASFAPMIIKLIMPKVVDKIMEMFKLDKVLKYVEMPNDADIKIEKLEEQVTLLARELGKAEDRLSKVEILNKGQKNGK